MNLTQGKLVQNGESLSRDRDKDWGKIFRMIAPGRTFESPDFFFSIWVAISMSYSVHCRCTFRQECFDCIGSTAKWLVFSYRKCFKGKSWYCLKCILKYWHCLRLWNGNAIWSPWVGIQAFFFQVESVWWSATTRCNGTMVSASGTTKQSNNYKSNTIYYGARFARGGEASAL